MIIESIFNDLDQKYNLQDTATEIIVSGVSAGGIGMYINIDYIKHRYPNARVTGVSIAGFYYYATYYDGDNATEPSSMADFRKQGVENMYNLYGPAYVDESCLTSSSMSSSCMFANYSFPYIDADLYAIQAQSDRVVLTGE